MPRLLGLAMITVGCVSLLLSGKELLGPTDLPATSTREFVYLTAGLALLQIVSGAAAILYQSRAPRLAVVYGLSAVALMASRWLVDLQGPKQPLYAIAEGHHLRALPFNFVNILDGIVDAFAIFVSYAFIAWPIAVVWLMTRTSSLQACETTIRWRLPHPISSRRQQSKAPKKRL